MNRLEWKTVETVEGFAQVFKRFSTGFSTVWLILPMV